jgi:hypothetical protein
MVDYEVRFVVEDFDMYFAQLGYEQAMIMDQQDVLVHGEVR